MRDKDMRTDLADRVAIVTGAGGGLGRSHALLLARHGARVVVNDSDAAAAGRVANEIEANGGRALAAPASVTDEEQVAAMVHSATRAWGGIDILVNNAGILRDKSFAKMELSDFRLVVDVHLMGAVNCTKAVWPIMTAQKYGRIVMTTSSSGLYGNFGQANYGAAKMALVGLMQTLSIEGAKNDIRVNCLAPTAATRMTEGLMPQPVLDALKPEAVVPAMLVLASQQAPNRTILCAGAGTFEAAHITMTSGAFIGSDADADERLAAQLGQVIDREGSIVPENGGAQGRNEVSKALAGAPGGA